jgi:septal ring factor EnvC (AmiA/AmiB activator)
MTRLFPAMLAVLLIVTSAAAQDVRGLEICTVEKTMERRTSCLQSNVEFLHQALAKHTHETRNKLNDANREIAAQKADIAALKTMLAKLHQELAELRKTKPEKK